MNKKVRIITDEFYPYYFMSTEGDRGFPGKYEEDIFNLPDKIVEDYLRVEREFRELHRILGKLVNNYERKQEN